MVVDVNRNKMSINESAMYALYQIDNIMHEARMSIM